MFYHTQTWLSLTSFENTQTKCHCKCEFIYYVTLIAIVLTGRQFYLTFETFVMLCEKVFFFHSFFVCVGGGGPLFLFFLQYFKRLDKSTIMSYSLLAIHTYLRLICTTKNICFMTIHVYRKRFISKNTADAPKYVTLLFDNYSRSSSQH